MAEASLTAEELRSLLFYDAETGEFAWKQARRGVMVGAKAGTACAHGYVEVMINQNRHYAHRLAWLYVTGHWPQEEIDHINRVKSDNRLVNLRSVTRIQNSENRPKNSNNTSGFKGVYLHKPSGRWRAEIQRNHKRRAIGYFETPEDASAAYEKADI